jgi:hypothetical protein
MITPDREAAEVVTWLIDGLIRDSDTLPPHLTVTLRTYREELLRRCASQPWARPGNRARYSQLANTVARHIADGIWKPGDRLPASTNLAQDYREREKTMRRALFVLAVRGLVARDRLAYYVLPNM